jgi:hypothetical protein
MATKEVIIADSSSGIVLVLLVVLAFGAFIAYQQGMFSDKKDFEINLPGGKEISGSVSE